jgi:hypothetical protein
MGRKAEGAGERQVRAGFREGDGGNVTVTCGRCLELHSSSWDVTPSPVGQNFAVERK